MMSYKSIHGIMQDANEIAKAIDNISTCKTVHAKYRKFLLKYYAIELTGADLTHIMTPEDSQQIIHQGVVYKIVWADPDARIYNYMNLVLSFRQTKHQLGTDNFCIVSLKDN